MPELNLAKPEFGGSTPPPPQIYDCPKAQAALGAWDLARQFYGRHHALQVLAAVEHDLAQATEPSPAQRYAIDYTLGCVRQKMEEL